MRARAGGGGGGARAVTFSQLRFSRHDVASIGVKPARGEVQRALPPRATQVRHSARCCSRRGAEAATTLRAQSGVVCALADGKAAAAAAAASPPAHTKLERNANMAALQAGYLFPEARGGVAPAAQCWLRACPRD